MTDQIKLFRNEEPSGGAWPSDIAAYYDKLDDKRGIKRARLIQGYKRSLVEKRDRDT